MILGKRHENLILALCALSLTVLGMIMIYSATNVMAGSSARLRRPMRWCAAATFRRSRLRRDCISPAFTISCEMRA